jgi:hypothetical protein
MLQVVENLEKLQKMKKEAKHTPKAQKDKIIRKSRGW